MHCGFLSYSLFFLTHIVALDAFIVLLSYLMLVIYISVPVAHFVRRAVARTLIGGGGGCLFIYSYSARLVSFQIDKFEFHFKRN